MSEDLAAGEVMLDAIVAITADADPDSILGRLVARLAPLTGADSVLLALRPSLGRSRRTFTHPEDRVAAHLPADPLLPVVSSNVGASLVVPVRAGGRTLGTMVLERTSTTPFDDTEDALARAMARVAGFVAETARATRRSERRHQWLEASARVLAILQGPLVREVAMQQIAQVARQTAQATAAAVVQVGGPDEPPRAVGTDGEDPGGLDALVVALADRVRAAHGGGSVLTATTAEGRGVLLAPLRTQVAEGGVLLLVHDAPLRALDAEEAGLLTAFADQVSLALDRAQALEDRQMLMLVGERDRIARDLHDQVIQRIFAAGLQLEGALRAAEPGSGPSATSRRIEAAIADLDATISQIRSTIFDLRPPDTGSVRARVSDVVAAYSPALASAPALRLAGPLDTAVPAQVAEQLVAVLREALSNVVRHAEAQEVAVDVGVEVDGTSGGHVSLVVVDDGVGIPAERGESGLRNLRRRAADLGGTCRVDTAAPRGTRVEWRVPYVPD